jgi:hypothetical protein
VLRFQAKFLCEAVKTTAEHLGLDPAHFSAHSLRKGGEGILALCGVPEQYQEMRGAWAEGSVAMRRVYALPFLAPIGPMAAAGADYNPAAEVAPLALTLAMRGMR